MVTSSSQQPAARRGFLASLSAALTPQPIPENDTGPLRPPKGVVTATVLAIVGGVLFLLQGVMGLTNIDFVVSSSQKAYSDQVATCQQVGGIGSAVSAASPTALVDTCQKMTPYQSADWDSLRSVYLGLFVVFVIIGLACVAAGWFLRTGAAWARRTLVTVTVVTVLGALFLQISGMVTLAATMAVLIAVVLCYLASGAAYFIRIKARKHA